MARPHDLIGADGDASPSALFASPPEGAPASLVAVRADAAWLARVGACLTPEEHVEAHARPRARRAAFTLGRSLLRHAAAEALRVAPEAVPLVRDASGRVRLPETGWHAGVTHSSVGEALFAGVVLARVPVGVDAEPVRPRADGLAARILADGEALPTWPASDDARLLAAWTAKEAALKADGLGLWQGAKAARIAWRPDGAFTAETPNGRWAGQGLEAGGVVWAVAWAG